MIFPPVIFVIGPSGVGKTEVSGWIAADLQFLHIDIDQHHGFYANLLHEEWHQFNNSLDPKPLLLEVQNRIIAGNYPGAVFSLPSNRILIPEQITTAKSFGILTALLWGSQELCKKAAFARLNGPVTNEARYDRSNKDTFDKYGRSEYDSIRIEAFRPDGGRWPREHTMDIIRRLIAS